MIEICIKFSIPKDTKKTKINPIEYPSISHENEFPPYQSIHPHEMLG
jgi:hypothetical protein